MRSALASVLAAALLVACSESDNNTLPAGTGPLCTDFMEKLRSCGVYGNGRLPCVDGITFGVGQDVGHPVSLRKPTDNAAHNARIACTYNCLMGQSCDSLIELGSSQFGFGTDTLPYSTQCLRDCTDSTYPCRGPDYSYVFHGVCNQRVDCPNSEDELGCANNFICGAGQVGRPIFAAERCDGRDSCAKFERLPDGTVLEEPGDDELDCPGDLFQCPDGSTVPDIWVCDGVLPNCANGEDELSCPDNFYCANGAFVPMTSVCDGTRNCTDGEDEADCAQPRDGVCR